MSASAGLRYEHARSRYYEQGILVPEQSRTYDDWLPTLSADFPLGKMQASLSYTAKTTRPSFMQLRSSMNYNNRYIYDPCSGRRPCTTCSCCCCGSGSKAA